MNEERFRALLDANGVLRGGEFDPPDRTRAYAVFAQRRDARMDAAILTRHAARFFETDLGLTVDKKYEAEGLPPEVDVANVVLSPREGGGGVRLAYARPVTDADHGAAEQADLRAGYTGLYTLAQRCKYVWLVEMEGAAPRGADDRLALLLAAILASVMLGPILSPDGLELFGVRTARLKLEKREAAYR